MKAVEKSRTLFGRHVALGILATAISLFGAGQAQAVVLDDFWAKNNSAWPFTSGIFTANFLTVIDLNVPGVYGGQRISGIRASSLAGAGDYVQADIDTAAGNFVYTSTAGAAGAFALHYENLPEPLDLVTEAVEIEIVDAPAGLAVQLFATFEWNGDISTPLILSGATSGGPEVLQLTPINTLPISPYWDADDVTMLEIQVEVPAGGSVAISEIRTVPEPATAGLLALAGGAFLRRRRG